MSEILKKQRDSVTDALEEKIGELICGEKRIDELSDIVKDIIDSNDEVEDIEIDLDCEKINSEKYKLVSLLRKKRDGLIYTVEEKIGDLICGKKRIDGLINIVKDLVHLNDEIYDIEMYLNCEKIYSDKHSLVICLRKQRDCVIGVLDEQIDQLIYKKKKIVGLINIVKDLVHLNDEIYCEL